MPTLSPFLKNGRNSKDAIISILSEEFPLSTKKVHLRLRKYGIEVSYQAAHKNINELVKDGVVEKTGNELQISKQWINQINYFGKKLASLYSQNKHGEIKTNADSQLYFDTLKDFDRFFIFEYFSLPHSTKNPIVANWSHMYSLIGLSEDDILGLKDIISKTDFYIFCSGKTPLDKFFGETFKKLGCKIKFGAKMDFNSDCIIYGEYILQAYWPKKIKKALENLFAVTKIRDFKLSHLLNLMHNKIEPIYVIINKNPALARKIIEERLKVF